MTPLDSLYASGELSLGSRILLKPIQIWQDFSYRSFAMNCQFESSCSNYMVHAIRVKGILPGLVIGTDRIVRCNPAARHYHLQEEYSMIQADGRLVEPMRVQPGHAPGRSPYIALGLSVIPGLGRSYAGHVVDGLFSFFFVSGFALNSAMHVEAGHTFSASVYGLTAGLFWAADFYGAYRTARSAVPKQ
ncbi:MAG: membrane protein insertion efficiency factor YidD [Candidatus Marinimicrobia bacterium]|nr:membrane protein insertion efficiency factor YidD [Candidatus Neomarinimicrobiota bacterium]MCF7850599.1 membrane protein insertion efficiency factor YidD [Candidatus Neomarinimicrobiota bacterium]MCF7903667.1 membrane protein insertion efficiency factor YidD [Candidatus Neomarinimicrobiota bacterium]